VVGFTIILTKFQGDKSIAYASVTNGIFLCNLCGQVHKSYNNDISYIVSLDFAGDWDEQKLNSMFMGGNSKLKQFFEQYNMPTKDVTPDYKYKTQAGCYYREMVMI